MQSAVGKFDFWEARTMDAVAYSIVLTACIIAVFKSFMSVRGHRCTI